MENPDQDQQDPRCVPSVEDTTAMTIEFLRARLLSERSLSKSARQRADELAKRVAELEEQLNFVSLQRKMAEKATADVLSILEENGASDISETLDSNSDHETPCESKVENDPAGENMHSSSIRRRNEHEEYSGSDIETSPVLDGSLSWKGRNDSTLTREKYKKNSIRSRSSFTSFGSPPKHHIGRSCRRIKHKDARALGGEQDLISEACVDSSQEIAPSTCSEDSQNFSVNRHKILKDGHGHYENRRSGSSEIHISVENKEEDHDVDGYEKVNDMEKALKCQAQLIDQYEAMEKVQREWEERFRENNNCTPDSYEPGNHSDITEERDEIRAQAPNLSRNAFLANEPKPRVAVDCVSKDSSEAQTNMLGPSVCADVEDTQERNMNSISTSRPLEEFTFPMAIAKQCQESQQESSCTSRINNHGLLERPLPSNGGISLYDQETPHSNKDRYALVPHEPPALNGILEALKQAKLSLTKKINKLPSVKHESIDPKIGNRLEIAVGFAGLFKLPTDFAAEASTRTNLPSLSSQLRSSSTHYPGEGVAPSANHQTFPGHEMEDRSSYLSDTHLRNSNYQTVSGITRDEFFIDNFSENRWRNPGQNPHFDPYYDVVQPSPHVQSYAPRSVSSNIHPDDSSLRTFPGRTAEMRSPKYV